MKTQPLNIYQGDDYNAVVYVTNQGAPVTLTGYTATAQIRRQTADSDPSVDATITCTISGSTVLLAIPHTVTALLSGTYMWDLQLTKTSDGTILTILAGPVHITAEVTRP